jgi:hypothetical protein
MSEIGYLSNQELNTNWTVPFNENEDNNNSNDTNGKTSNQKNV